MPHNKGFIGSMVWPAGFPKGHRSYGESFQPGPGCGSTWATPQSSPGGFWDIFGRAIPHPQSSRFNSLALPHTHPGAGETWKEEFLLLFSQGEALINAISGVSRLFFSCFCHIPPRIWGEWLDLWNPTQAMPTPFVSSFFYTGEMDQIPGE